MKDSKNNFYNHIKQPMFRIIAIVLILSGGLVTADNTIEYLRSTFAYPSEDQSEQKLIDKQLTSGNQTSQADTEANNQLSIHVKTNNLYEKRPEIGDEFGELYIPKLKKTIPIIEGTEEEELDQGVGHFVESVLPGENDNSVLSGHRDTVFQRLGEIEIGDTFVVRTSAGEFEYKIYKIRIVDKDDRTVIVPKPRATLTVSTCYPFSYIGSAPQRYILIAYLTSEV